MKKVVVIDSGSGGLNVLKELYKNCIGFDFLYLADTAYAPYGNKTKRELIHRAKFLVDFADIIFSPDIFVFACNTLTATTINEMRKKYNKVFIGCEPAIKPACEEFQQEDVLVLATKSTLRNSKLLKRYPLSQKKIIDRLPTMIDENLFELDKIVPYLKKNIEKIQPKAIVLGCTHFEAIKKQLKQISSAKLFSSSYGIAKQLKKYADGSLNNSCSFITTADCELLLPKYFYYFFKNEYERLN